MITIEDAYSYFYNERLFAEDWLMAENNKQEQSLKMASNQINRLRFSKYNDEYKEDNLKKAICEQAFFKLSSLYSSVYLLN